MITFSAFTYTRNLPPPRFYSNRVYFIKTDQPKIGSRDKLEENVVGVESFEKLKKLAI